MATLHLVLSTSGYAACEGRCSAEDTIVLLQDGVYATPDHPQIAVLEGDARARGVYARHTPGTFIDMAGLVALTEDHTPIVTWR